MKFRACQSRDHDACITENWYTEGLHRYDMRLTLDDEQRSRITPTLAVCRGETEP